jgi:hypothetical protein
MSQRDPLADPTTQAHYSGFDVNGKRLWPDDPRVVAAREAVRAWHEQTYSNEDLIAQKRDAGLRQMLNRVQDAYGSTDDGAAELGSRRMPLDEYAASEHPADVTQHRLAKQIVEWSNHPAYLDARHPEHERYVAGVTDAMTKLYGSDRVA